MKKKIKRKHRYLVKQSPGTKTLYEAPEQRRSYIYLRPTAFATSTNYSGYYGYGITSTINYKSKAVEKVPETVKAKSIRERIISLWKRIT